MRKYKLKLLKYPLLLDPDLIYIGYGKYACSKRLQSGCYTVLVQQADGDSVPSGLETVEGLSEV